MAVNLVRFTLNGGPRRGVAQANGVAPLAGGYPTTAALIERGEDDWRAAAGQTPSIGLEAIELLSPVTTPCRVFCQGANYRRHMIESGLDPDAKAFNMFFMKSDASISPAIGSVRPPCHVKLLFREPDAADHPQLLGRRQFASPHNGAEEAEAQRLQGIALDELRDLAMPVVWMKASTVDGLLAKARAMKFAFPEDGAIVERIEEGLKEEGPFDAEPMSFSLARDLLALAREEARS
jgi:hypothetical protein